MRYAIGHPQTNLVAGLHRILPSIRLFQAHADDPLCDPALNGSSFRPGGFPRLRLDFLQTDSDPGNELSYSFGSTAHDTIYAISPRCGGTTSSPTQISRISVTSMSKYSAYPVHTPAIFLPASIRRSLRGATVSPPAAAADGTAEPTPVGRPQLVQKRAESSSFTPHRVQNISCKDYITTHLSAAGVFRHVQGLERRRETRKQSFRRVSNARVEMGEEKS